MVWTRALAPGLQQGTPLVRDGVLYMPNPRDVIQALDAVSGDLIWEYRRDRPEDLADFMIGSLIDTNRNLAIHDRLIIDTSGDDYVFALDAETGDLVWETEILDYRGPSSQPDLGPNHCQRQGHLRSQLRPTRRSVRVRDSGARRRHGGRVVAASADSRARRAGRRILG